MASTQSETDSFLWIGPAGGDWQTPSDWDDLTTGTAPSSLAPDAESQATITNGAVIAGAGAAGELTLLGTASTGTAATLAGTFAIGLLALSGYEAGLTVGSMATLTTGSIDLTADYAGGITVAGAGARLDDTGGLAFGTGGTIAALAGGSAEIAGMAASGAIGAVVGDTLSALEIGTIGDATAGTLTVDAGETVALADVAAPSIAIEGVADAAIADFTGTLEGAGTIAAPVEFVDTSAFAADSALTLSADGLLILPPSIPVTTTISLTGSNALLAFAPGPIAVAGDIAGLTLGDDIVVASTDPVTGADYTAGASGGGSLLLIGADGSQVGSLSLLGSFAGDDFLVTPLSPDGTIAQINIAGRSTGIMSPLSDKYLWIGPSGGAWDVAANWRDESGNAPLPPGANSSATIVGGAAGATYASPTIDGSAGSLVVGEVTVPIVGPGSVGDLVVTGNVALDGAFTATEIDLTAGTLTIGPMGTLMSGYVEMTTLGLAISVIGSGATLDAGYGLSLDTNGPATGGTAAASDIFIVGTGAQATLATTALGSGSTLIVSDAASWIQIGESASTGPGDLTVGAGIDLAVSSAAFDDSAAGQAALVAPTIINDGLVSVTVATGEYSEPQFDLLLDGTITGDGVFTASGATNSFTKFGTFSGFGTIIADGPVLGSLSFVVGTLGLLALPDVVGAGDSITLTGVDARLSFTGGAPFAVDAPISGFGVGDAIGLAIGDTVESAIFTQTAANSGTLALTDPGGTLVGDLVLNGTYGADQFAVSGNQVTLEAPCFRAGTRLATPDGPVAVETLVVGQRVLTVDGGAWPIRWLGRRALDCRRHPRPELVWPVRVRAGAFGQDRPGRDLFLSPDHAVFADGMLIPVKHLINGRSIAQIETGRVEYWHVELERHSVLLAENLPVESYLDTGNRDVFVNGADNLRLHPDFAPLGWDDACAPLVQDGPSLVAVKRRLFGPDRAPPAMSLHVRRIGDELELTSPAWMPAACYPGSLDRRRLGVRLFGVAIDGAKLGLDSPAFSRGFHPPEITAEGCCRWTNGDAALAVPATTSVVTLWLDKEVRQASSSFLKKRTKKLSYT